MSPADFTFIAAHTPAPTRDEVGAAASPTDRGEQFVAVTGPESEQVSAPAMVVGAYGLFWLIAFGFVYLTYRSQVRLATRLAKLEQRLPKDTLQP
jgi:hypothetical protein